MNRISILLVVIMSVGLLGYSGNALISNHIESQSGAIVEKTLSDNTISQLALLLEVQRKIEAGNIEQASSKITESISTLKYILKNNCSLATCKEALEKYEGK